MKPSKPDFGSLAEQNTRRFSMTCRGESLEWLMKIPQGLCLCAELFRQIANSLGV